MCITDDAPDNGAVQVTRGYKYRTYVNQEQQQHLAQAFGSARFVYNRILEVTSRAYSEYKEGISTKKPSINNVTLSRMLTELKSYPEHDWLYDVSSVHLQQSVFNLVDAYRSFFRKGIGYPKFKSRRNKQSITYNTAGFKVVGKNLYIAKLKQPLKLRLSRPLPSEPSYCTISKTPSGKYYVSFICTYTPTRKSGHGTIGIDVGITDLATMSDGTTIDNPRHYVKAQQSLARAQRSLSRKRKGSNNRTKQRYKVTRVHERIGNQRDDYLHKLSSKLVSDNQAIAIESLSVSNMIRNRHLAKHIADASWGKFREMLEYKVQESDSSYLYLADPYFPSTQLCSDCGVKPKIKIKLQIRKWICSNCGSVHQRDHNAAKNLKRLAEVMHSSVLRDTTIANARVYKTHSYAT